MNSYANVNYQKCCKYIDIEILFLNSPGITQIMKGIILAYPLFVCVL